MFYRKRRKKSGGAIIETVAGLFVVIPVVLFLVDIVSMVLAQMANDALAKDCARAAAEENNAGAASGDVATVISHFNCPTMTGVSAPVVNFDTASGTVYVQTQATFTFPVQIPFWGQNSQVFVAEAKEPIIGILSP